MSLIKNVLRLDKKCLYKFLINMGWKGLRAFNKYKKRIQKGDSFPAFQFISVTNDCNLRCQGCWVNTDGKAQSMSPEKIQQIIDQSKQRGSYFFGILGGEPLMYKSLFQIFESNPDCYFQLFTNGTLLNADVAERLRKCGNVTPLISLEGDEIVADIRRGGNNVYARTLKAVETATQLGLVTGVAVSVCKSNIDMALSEQFVEMLHQKGVIYLWYYIYRPTGSQPSYELALSIDEINRLRRFLVDGRTKYPMVLIDSYWRANGEPFCPAADGLSHHINPYGMVEPCPVIQYATDQVNGVPIHKMYNDSGFLNDFKTQIQDKTKGCILMEEPSWLVSFAEKHRAVNTSNRTDMEKQLLEAKIVPSHGASEVIPEKSWIYRMAKKRAFFGLGAYG